MPTVHSERRGELHLGKTAPKPIENTVPYSDLRKCLVAAGVTLPKPPTVFGHGDDFTGTEWLMLGNGPDDTVFPGFQGCGDCAWAGPAHEEKESAKNAGRAMPQFSGKTVVAQYSAYSGYDPQTGTNDNGSAIADVIKWRQDKGIYDDTGTVYKIGRAVSLTPGNLAELWEAAFLFECAGIGIQVPASVMQQFDAGQPWSYVKGSPIEGGHYIPVIGKLELVSWAETVKFTDGFYEHYNDETVCYLDNERYNAVTGETAEHYSHQDLEKYLVLIAQAKLG
jgi:hypothetical protein